MGSLQIVQDVASSQVDTSFWYAVHVRSRHEKRVAAELEQKGITTFLPLLSETRKWSDRKVKVEFPLFSCYLFVNIAAAPETRVSVLRTSGVLTFVGGNHLESPIPTQQIEQIQTILEKKIPFSTHPYLEVGQRVRICGGALDGVEGVLSRFGGNNRLIISVQTIQRSLSITVEGYDVEPLEVKRTMYV
jgi:transcription termination/antitermination protein NusG